METPPARGVRKRAEEPKSVSLSNNVKIMNIVFLIITGVAGWNCDRNTIDIAE